LGSVRRFVHGSEGEVREPAVEGETGRRPSGLVRAGRGTRGPAGVGQRRRGGELRPRGQGLMRQGQTRSREERRTD
jgi:hypothetical protein